MINRKIDLFRSNFFILAIAISLIWHVLWLVSIKIVIVPDQVKAVRFSKVSFLGPMLSGGNTEFRLEPKAPSFLEKRYIVSVNDIDLENVSMGATLRAEGHSRSHLEHNTSLDNTLRSLISEVISGQKLEPPSFLDHNI